MNWKIVMAEISELGALFVALWIPFRMGRAGISNPWPMVAGWLALTICGVAFMWVWEAAINANDSELANSVFEGTHVLLLFLFGSVLASGAAAMGRKKINFCEKPKHSRYDR